MANKTTKKKKQTEPVEKDLSSSVNSYDDFKRLYGVKTATPADYAGTLERMGVSTNLNMRSSIGNQANTQGMLGSQKYATDKVNQHRYQTALNNAGRNGNMAMNTLNANAANRLAMIDQPRYSTAPYEKDFQRYAKMMNALGTVKNVTASFSPISAAIQGISENKARTPQQTNEMNVQYWNDRYNKLTQQIAAYDAASDRQRASSGVTREALVRQQAQALENANKGANPDLPGRIRSGLDAAFSGTEAGINSALSTASEFLSQPRIDYQSSFIDTPHRQTQEEMTPIQVGLKDFSGIARNVASDFQRRSETQTAYTKSGLGTVGSFIADAGIAGTQMLIDAAAGGGNAMPLMMVRSFGYGAQEAYENGGDVDTQVLTGLKSAAIEYLTEKLFRGNPLYDQGGTALVTDTVNKLARKIVGSDAVDAYLRSSTRRAMEIPLDMMQEGVEEVLSDYLNPLVDAVMGALKGNGWNYEAPEIETVINDFLVGAALGGGGHVTSAVSGLLSNSSGVDTDLLKQAYGDQYNEVIRALAREADALDPRNSFVQQMNRKLESGEELTFEEAQRLQDHNRQIVESADTTVLQQQVEMGLRTLGEQGDVSTVASAIVNRLMNRTTTFKEDAALRNSEQGAGGPERHELQLL